MSKFRYRMQSILDIKLKMETLAKQDFAAAMTKLNEEEGKLEELKARKMGYEQEARRLLSDTLSVLDIQENNNAIARIEEFIEEQKKQVEAARRNLEREREKLAEAMKERKVHENLKEKEFEEFIQEENKSENLVTDELTSYRYGQKE